MIPYIVHVALIISVCLCFYMLLLRRETFHRINRFVLIGFAILSFTLPLISVPQQWAFNVLKEPATLQNSSTRDNFLFTEAEKNKISEQKIAEKASEGPVAVSTSPVKKNVPIWPLVLRWAVYLFWTGVVIFACNFLLQLIVLLYRALSKPTVKDGRFRIVELTGDKAPCSFANYIFINPSKYEWETYNQILLHEKTHIRQGHTVDILFAELLVIFQWFNPFAWIYRKELENNLEFLTDSCLLEKHNVEKEKYQLSLLRVSVPHLSLGLTTNYNQSILQKRIVMMNQKKSNFNTMWKYFFLLPLIAALMCTFNSTVADAQTNKQNQKSTVENQNKNAHNDRTTGSWFATIKGDKIRIQFRSDDDSENWSNNADFMVTEFSALPKNGAGEFTLKREAGTINFKGKFDGDKGYGDYKFIPDNNYNAYLKSEGITGISDDDLFTFFMIDIKKDYVKMLGENGYKNISKDELIPMAALKVDGPYIQMWKKNGFTGLSSNELVSAKALGIDNDYVSDIKTSGFDAITLNQLISFKAQHITGDYIKSLRKAKVGDSKNMPDADEITAFKAMDIDDNFIKSFESIGYKDISYNDLTSMKATGITPEFIKSFIDLGYKDITVQEAISLKSTNVSAESVKNFQSMGFTDISLNDMISAKSTGVNAEYIKGFRELGFTSTNLNSYVPLKSLGITPEFVNGFKKLGFTNVSLDELPALKSTGVTPEFIKSMQEKGIKLNSLDKYIQLKTAMD